MNEPSSSEAQVIKLSRFRADASKALARRGHALLEAADLAEQVAKMPPLELFYVVKELGTDDALPILLAATQSILQSLCDLDCWRDDDLAADELDVWLAPFAELGPEELAAAFLSLDDEVQVRFLQQSVVIFDNREDAPTQPDIPDDVPTRVTPDGVFLMANIAPEREVDIFTLMDALVGQDASNAFALLTATKWELPTALGEQAKQFRDARLMEMGFASPEAAAKLFGAPPKALAALSHQKPSAQALAQDADPLLLKLAPVPHPLPALHASILTQNESALGQALAAINDPALVQRLSADFVYLVNRLMVARHNATHDLKDVQQAAQEARDTLSLALDTLAGANHQDACDLHAAALASWPLVSLFQLGASQLTQLARQARQMAADPVVARWLDVVADPAIDPQVPDRAFLRHLAVTRPLWAGFDPQRPDTTRAWSTTQQVEESRQRLDALAARLG